MDDIFIKNTALGVRREFENRSVDAETLKELYQGFNPVTDIDSFIAEAKKIFPDLNCGVATVYLKFKLGTGTVVRGFYGKHPHTFLRISDALIVDITADQYGGPKVYVGELVKPWSIGA